MTSRPAPSYRALKKASKTRKSVRRQWGTTLPHSTKRPKKMNTEAQAKRRARYRKGLAAYRKSECYKQVEQRARGQCEKWELMLVLDGSFNGATMALTKDPTSTSELRRCLVTRAWPFSTAPNRLTHHHKTYARFGGSERPEDVIVLCERHNAEAEAQHPTRRRNYR